MKSPAVFKAVVDCVGVPKKRRPKECCENGKTHEKMMFDSRRLTISMPGRYLCDFCYRERTLEATK